jgi:hypothetical protein
MVSHRAQRLATGVDEFPSRYGFVMEADTLRDGPDAGVTGCRWASVGSSP